MTNTHTSKEQKLADEIAELEAMPISDLRSIWRRLYRTHPPKSLRRDLIQIAVAWRLQEKALGPKARGHSAATKRQLKELAQTLETKTDLAKARRVRLRPGARLVREWDGDTHCVIVLENGLEFEGRQYNSLSAIARKITGARWSGPRFFGIDKPVAQSPTDVEQQVNA